MKTNDFYGLWELTKDSNFNIQKHNIRYDYNSILDKILNIEKSLLLLSPSWEHKTVIVDIKDRLTFILFFLVFSRLKSIMILVPIEVNPDEYMTQGGIYITDNKKIEAGLLITEELNLIVGSKFIFDNNNYNMYNHAQIFLYTSGSGGNAKLIPKTFDNLYNEIKELKIQLEITENDIFYFTPPIYHIYGILFCFLLPILCKSTLIIDHYFTPETVALFVKENKVSVFITIPPYYKMFYDLDLIEHFKFCRILTNSSAPLPFDISKAFYDKGIKINEIYGSTETGGIAKRIAPENEVWEMFSYVKILESHIKGNNKQIELLINSPTISVLYDNDMGFNTGDLVNLVDSKHFLLLGRNTRFVKISGKRVDLQYVLERIKQYFCYITKTSVSETDIYVGEKAEKLFILYNIELNKSITEIKNDLKHILPGYVVPRYFIKSVIPRNSMGKLNKNKIDELTNKFIKNI